MVLTTARLELRPLAEGDLDLLFAHWSAPEMHRWLWNDQPPTREAIADDLAASAETFARLGFGLWGVFRSDGVFLGVCGLSPVPEQAGEFELVFSIEPHEWRRGYALEATEAVLDHVLGAGRDRVMGRCDRRNEAARRLVEKLGKVFESRAIEGVADCYFQLRRRP